MTEDFEMNNKHHEFCERAGELCYSEKEARHVLNYARRTRHKGSYKRLSSGKIPKRIYWCAHCGCFHTTSQLNKHVYIGWGYKKRIA